MKAWTVQFVAFCCLGIGIVRAEPLTMPELYGLSEPEAREALAASGFVEKIHIKETNGKDCDHEGEAVGTVCGQSPLPGRTQEATLDVWVFINTTIPKKKETQTMPYVAHHDEDWARRILAGRGFTGIIETKMVPWEECERSSGPVVPGTVCNSIPRGYERDIPVDAPITLLLLGDYGINNKYGMVPNVIGMSPEQALATLRDQNFTNLGLRPVVSKGCAPGTVCGVSDNAGPAESKPVLRRAPLAILVATRYPDAEGVPFRAPDLTGDTVLEAYNKLDSLGFRNRLGLHFPGEGLGRCPEGTSDLEPGVICKQFPAPGKKLLNKGYYVSIMLKKNPSRRFVEMPNVKGMSLEEARSRLARAGLTELIIEEQVVSGCAVATVCESRPPGLTRTPTGAAKVLIVGAEAPVSAEMSDQGESAASDMRGETDSEPPLPESREPSTLEEEKPKPFF